MDGTPVQSDVSQPPNEEHQHLDSVLRRLDSMLEQLHRVRGPDYEGIDRSEAQTAEQVAEEVVAKLRESQITALTTARSDPYFGRLDFAESRRDDVDCLYIGKCGIEDTRTGDRMVVDWRAPIASMFYSFSGQETASYKSPDGTVEGRVFLKRNIVVRDNSLQRVVDSYVAGQDNLNVTDEFLLYRLSDNKDSRLRDIVSTIQVEQDRIIRADRALAAFIQGVAGSGKTTVALHRIAYLL